MNQNQTQQRLNVQPVVAKALSILSDRNATMLAARFGLSEQGARETLESIGRTYNITRERVRQIEEASYHKIRNSAQYELLTPSLDRVSDFIASRGGVVAEEQLLNEMVAESQKPHLSLLLAISGDLEKIKESDAYRTAWALSRSHAETAKTVLASLVDYIKEQGSPVSDESLFEVARQAAGEGLEMTPETFEAILSISKAVKKSPFGHWGLASWPQVSPRGVRDKAYLIFEREERPLHFRDIASLIDNAPFEQKTARGTHPQTVHNELIKDTRFVLVGRGTYALAKWGYTPGTVKDVIMNVLQKEGDALHRDEIIDRVLKQRMVQKNTVLLNLQNKKHFKKTGDNHFYLA